MRGEKRKKALLSFGMPGSPPLARGKEKFNLGKKFPDRITPACAGKSIAFEHHPIF